MSLLHFDYDRRRVCASSFPFFNNITLGRHPYTAGVHITGALPAHAVLARPWDRTLFCMHSNPPYSEPDYAVPVHVSSADWVPPACALISMLVENLIDEDFVYEEPGFGDARVVWRAGIIFMGFAFMTDGLAEGVATLVLKYAIRVYQQRHGDSANVAVDVSLMLSAVVLWIAQSGRRE
ncbi:UPF0220-domain-containing protein [Gloeopeniophorella convolvens]|nr:UPF0220-domain-containing protein [Gloeopeniophorella convolvens]